MLCSLQDTNSALVSAGDSGAGVVGDRGRGSQRPPWAYLLHSRRRKLVKPFV
jgi:hypothetical protein